MRNCAKVYIGWDERERLAFNVAARSLLRRTSIPIDVEPIKLERCKKAGLIYRPMDRKDGKIWDVLSEAYCSTEFAISRFLVPIMQHEGFALFVDSDVVFLCDVAEVFALADMRKAVQVVKHPAYLPASDTKMDGQVQTAYHRKNWSSVVLWNCGHPAHERLSLGAINTLPGRALHQFFWLNADEIGELPPEFNWLVGIQDKPANPKIAHYTLGTPDMPGLEQSQHSDIWWRERKPQVVGETP